MMPSSQQVETAILAHYGAMTVGARTYDQPRDAAMARRIAARRILNGVKRNARPAVAALNALSMETAHEDVPMTRDEREDACDDMAPVGSLARLWQANPRCHVCGENIATPRKDDAARLWWFTPERLAHVKHSPGTSCFITAYMAEMRRRKNPEHIKDILPRVLPGMEQRP